MRKVVSADLQDLIEVQVDPDTESADWDGSLARFLLSYVRSKQSRSTAADPAEAAAERAGDGGQGDDAAAPKTDVSVTSQEDE